MALGPQHHCNTSHEGPSLAAGDAPASNNASASTPSGSRKPYAAPALRAYGDLRRLTRTTGNHSSPDGGTITGKTKTNP
jgi:hypothetical protein